MNNERHVVLIHPEIHWNTGNIGRTCLGAGAALHLVKPLGFSLEDRMVKRAGLDYWHLVNPHVWDDYNTFCTEMTVKPEEVVLLTKGGKHSFRELPERERLFLIFGSETRGLPDDILNLYGAAHTYYIPISSHIRSLNLSTAAAVVLYESLRFAESDIHAWS